MKIGLLSDTHGYLDPKIPDVFAGVDHILHAGDIGRLDVLSELKLIAPVTAVLGNVDEPSRGLRYVEQIVLAGHKFFIVHVGRPSHLTADLRRAIFEEARPDMVVFGHTHRPEIVNERGIVFFNPGGAGHGRFGLPRTAAIADVPATGPIDTRWIELE